MELSIFLAKLLGLYFVIVAADLLVRKNAFESTVRDFAHSKGLLVLSGSMSLMFGLFIAIAHPVFETSWRGLITLIGYLSIFRGIARIAFPGHIQRHLPTFCRKNYGWIVLVVGLVGLYLAYTGFNTFVEMD
jgi:uncharacterized membrane protein HdeD (DUF308 family)